MSDRLRTASIDSGPTDGRSYVAPNRGRRLLLRIVISPRVSSLGLFVALVAFWQVKGNTNLTSKPSLVAQRLWTLARDGSLWHNTWPTLEETVGGLAIGVIVGFVGGVIMATSQRAGTALDPYVVGINGLPKVALGPFFVVWFGIGITSKVLLSASIVFVVVLFNTREGIQSMDRDLADALRSMGANRRKMLRHLVIPSLAPWMLSSIKIGIGLALTGAVVGELVGATAGLGWYISYALNSLDVTGAMSALVVMAAIAMIMYYMVIFVEDRVLSWRDGGTGRKK